MRTNFKSIKFFQVDTNIFHVDFFRNTNGRSTIVQDTVIQVCVTPNGRGDVCVRPYRRYSGRQFILRPLTKQSTSLCMSPRLNRVSTDHDTPFVILFDSWDGFPRIVEPPPS